MHCGVATPTDPGVPPRVASTGAFEVAKVTEALAGRYKVERILGEGGMATVYLATDQKHKRKVAVKVMRPELAATLGAERFLREVEIAGQLSHPHILPMHDSGESDGILYYVMPYVEGETLRERLQRDGALPVEEALKLAREVAEALAYAHRRNIVHRDIKPANILLSEGHALVADFGIARAVGDSGGEQLTRTGLAVGTPQYMAPEQATGEKEVDGRADVYATGSVLYEMIAGEPPFTGPTARIILTRSLTEKARALSSVREGLVPSVDALVSRALAKNPGDRFATADALVTALDGARQQMTSASSSAITPPAATEVLPKGKASSAGDAGPKTWLNLRNGVIAAVAVLAIWAVTATVVAGRAGTAGKGGGAGGTGNRIAVLPFENQGATTDEYFADGISDEVRGKLSRVKGLEIIASSSTSEYKGSSKTPTEIARELRADYLLVGKVRWAGAEGGKRRVQVVPELIDTRTGSVKWQQTFDNEISDVFEVQSQIATRVAGALGVALGGGEKQDLGDRPTANVAAYQLYLKARATAIVDIASLRQAADLFELAVALDSSFAIAWADLSGATARLYSNGAKDPSVSRRSKEALDRAIALDPNGVKTHLAASRYHAIITGNSELADAEIALALQAAPNDAEVLGSAATADLRHGKPDSAVAKLQHAREIDPRSFSTVNRLGDLFSGMGRPADAEEAYSTALVINPGDLTVIHAVAMQRVRQGKLELARAGIRSAIEGGTPATWLVAEFAGRNEHSWMLEDRERLVLYRLTPSAFDDDRAWWGQSLAAAYWQQGDTVRARAYADSALAMSKQQAEANPDDAELQVLYGLVLAMAGKPAEARTAVARALAIKHATDTRRTRAYAIVNGARIELVLGSRDKALAYLEQLFSENYGRTGDLFPMDPFFRGLRGDPRFEALVAKGV
jgi:serine/threonine-protein kinase